MIDLLVKGVRLDGREHTWDIAVADGRIVTIRPSDRQTEDTRDVRNVIDGTDLLALPPYVEPHIHLDAVLTAGEPRWNESGTLWEGIQCWSERKPKLNIEDVKRRATVALRWMLAQGIQYVRTHVDVTEPNLSGLKALLEIKEKVAPKISLQIVAFPQEGIYSYERGRGAELLEEALRMGADVVGAIPHFEYIREYGVQSIDFCFAMAEKYDRRIDAHCDEIDDEQSRFVEVVAARALETDMKDRVTASHLTAMHSYNGAYAYKLFALMKKADINVVANPLTNMTLQGRFDAYPKRRGITRIKELLEAGINVSLGNDCIMDPWYSLGTGNPLHPAFMAIHAGHLTGRREVMAAVDMITWRGARALGVEDAYGIDVGKPANFNLLPVEDTWDLMRRMPLPRYVISRGQVVAETPVPRTTVRWDDTVHEIDFRR
ncbi:cytosine deaminase [Kyrpidia spormannii]|uniref:Cytosine deaminase n=2 Tax=Kyrpidia spormannii TaxID=2055160 RepID=A0ACA8ZDQ9_9BACL|nr:cytosine deaminase [Kyrpidia spormannii]CAB3395286.1 cytosine deaminase [Kyrpidia spormannii]CAB3396070.1 cytosine deaminase [Kyrpidia spormannii]